METEPKYTYEYARILTQEWVDSLIIADIWDRFPELDQSQAQRVVELIQVSFHSKNG